MWLLDITILIYCNCLHPQHIDLLVIEIKDGCSSIVHDQNRNIFPEMSIYTPTPFILSKYNGTLALICKNGSVESIYVAMLNSVFK